MFRKTKTMKPKKDVQGCETCEFLGSEVAPDPEDKEVLRCYCKVRFVSVDIKLMAGCDFFKIHPQHQTKNDSRVKGV